MKDIISDIKKNLTSLRKQIELTCKQVGRDPKSVLLLAVSKKQPLNKLKEITSNDEHKHFGENYAQELMERQKYFPHLKWHFIGSLQPNKLKFVIGNVYLVHSMSSFKHLKQGHQIAQKKCVTQDILLQVNLSHETSKQGFTVDQLESVFTFLEECEHQGYGHLKCKGLMILPPLTQNAEDSKVYFQELKSLLNRFKKQFSFLGEDFKQLSMGTSQDFIVAIEEGATIVRLGECLFGPRN